MSSADISVNELSYRYPDGHVALSRVKLSIQAGERVALLGPNGAGKTTLALHLNGILRPASGTVEVGGLPLTDSNLTEIRRQVGMVFHDANDQLFMPTVREDVAFGPNNLGFDTEEIARRTRDALGLVDASDLTDRTPHHLSAGEKRRVALATVLSMDPKVLVLDEPTSGLDPSGRRSLASVLSMLPQSQLVITHDLPFAAELCPRSAIMNRGQIVAFGQTLELLRDPDLMKANNLELPYLWMP